MLSRRMQIEAFGAPLVLRCDAVPEPVGSELLVKVMHCGVCHTDLHLRDGQYDLGEGRKLELAQRGISLPMTPGHEIFGEVVSGGADASSASIGRRGIVYPWIGCGSCSVCRSGHENLCAAPRCLGIHRPGGYADHVIVPHERYLVSCDFVAPPVAATLACSGLTAFSALGKLLPLERGEGVGIIGLGGVGMAALTLAPLLGLLSVVAFDRDGVKREAALERDARLACDPADQDAAAAEVKASLGDNGKVAGVIDFVGSPETFSFGTNLLRRGGRYVLVGLYGGAVTLPLPTVALKPFSIIGSYVGSLAELGALVMTVRRATRPLLPYRERPLAEVEDALAQLEAGRVLGRTVLDCR